MWARPAPRRAPLLDAVKSGDTAAVRALLKQPNSANVGEADGTTALHWATDRDDLATAELLIRAGANVKAVNRYGVTPLYSAAVNGNAAMIERLLDAGADANAALPEGETALMTAARTGKVEAVKVLLQHGADVNAKERWKHQTALMWAAHEGNAATVKLLLDAGAQINDRSLFGWTPLLFAARQGQIDTIKTLVAGGANVNDTLPDKTSALVTAIQGLNYEAAEVLLENGVDPNASGQGWTALHQVVWSRRPQRGQNNPGQKPRGDLSSLELAKTLVAHGADINARETKEPNSDMEGRNSLNRFGATPFFLAAKSCDVPMMQVLLGLGADPFHRQRGRGHAVDGGSGGRRLLAGRESGRARGIGRSREDPAGPRRPGERPRQERRNRAARPGLERIERGGHPVGRRGREARRPEQPRLAAADDRRRRLLQRARR